MTVEELIQQLQTFPENADVEVADGRDPPLLAFYVDDNVVVFNKVEIGSPLPSIGGLV